MNKVLLIAAERRPVLVSALTGQGLDQLLALISERLARGRSSVDLVLEGTDGQGLNWLYEHAEIMRRDNREDGTIHLSVRVAPDRLDQVLRRFPADRPADAAA